MANTPLVLSLEQATSLPYATLRFVQLGWRVIRIEAPGPGPRPGDPNRYVGAPTGEAGLQSLFVGNNVGKQAVAIDLKADRGRAVLHRLVAQLKPDVFCCNILPAGYAKLGIDYPTLAALRPELIWAGISAMGPDYPDTAGYDPVIQAMSGIMDLTGAADGPPQLVGLPITDLKAGDELYANVLLAMLERCETGLGRRIDISMLQAASSWLVPTLSLLDLDGRPDELTRSGNAHRHFVPTGVYRTADGFIYMAIGNDTQWQRFTDLAWCETLRGEAWRSISGRHADRSAVLQATAMALQGVTTAALVSALSAERIACTQIQTPASVREMPAIASRLNRTEIGGKSRHLPPAAVDLAGLPRAFAAPPAFGADTEAVLAEAGYGASEIAALRHEGAVV